MTDVQKETKKLDQRARVTFGSVGRKIGQRHIQLLGEDGEELGTMHRADVIRLMDETGLRLVAINYSCDPPLYRLMKGKQIHEEQMKLRDTQKTKKGAYQSKKSEHKIKAAMLQSYYSENRTQISNSSPIFLNILQVIVDPKMYILTLFTTSHFK